jgi:hypothetical protein
MGKQTLDERVREVLRSHYGSFDTFLEEKYESTITDRLIAETFDKKHEWATYNQVVLELKNNLSEMQLVKELQYRLTDYESPRDACIEVISSSKNVTPELLRLYEKIKNFND